jgi:glycosyltransferase involved in cell wall biosynthesis
MAEMPKLSIVIGANNARASIRECLTVLNHQAQGRPVEIIVVDNSTDGTAEIVSKQFPHLKLVRSPESSFIPELWEVGMRESRGEIVAITTAHCVPHKNWIEEVIKAHESPYSGIGGAIENDQSAGPIDWAIYFCRYSLYMLPFKERFVEDFAGDNASYKRWAVDQCTQVRRNGFWEPFVHAELVKAGLKLFVTPNIVVDHKRSFTLPGFMNQRFWHGKQFGSERASRLSGLQRLLYILASPLIPFLFLLRISRRVLAKKKHVEKYLMTLPILMLFLISWAIGEMSGYLWIAETRK